MLSLINLVFLIAFTKSAKPSYIKSIFGAPGTDEVENEYVDGIEILQTGLSHPQTQSIYNKGFSSKPIESSDYPYPGHDLNGTCTWALLQEESNKIMERYSFSNLTQLYRHPAAAQQYYTTDAELNDADRVKIRFTLQPNYERHLLPAFVPPGEIATIEIPESLIGKLSISFNQHTRNFEGGDQPQFKQRLNKLLVQQIYLNSKTNKVGLPYGGTVTFYYSGMDPVEVTVSGVILQPYFYYGMTSDEEWENTISKYPGPITYLDAGNIVFHVPSKFVRSATRMNDAMHYWRSAIQISQTTARDVPGYNNERYGRILNPVVMKYDSFVPAGAAVAFVGGNFCHFPPDWISSVVNFDQATDNPWGTVHEINHHHQSGWAESQEHGEMSNNVVNLCIYAKTNDCSSRRTTSGGLSDWAAYSIAATKLNDNDSYGLARYSTLIHMFGVEKFKQFVKADQEDRWYPRKDYGNSGAEMLRASHVFNRDMRRHWNFHQNSDNDLTKRAVEEVSWLNLKPFHPVTNFYAVGHVVDGVGFTTARPFQIDPVEQTIDFVSTMIQRENHDWFGEFEFSGCQFEPGREKFWKSQTKGVYTLTPKENLTEVEEVNVSYRDKKTGDTHVVICQFIQTNNVAKFTRIGFIPRTENNILKAYKYVAEKKYNESDVILSQYRKDGIYAGDYTNNSILNWLSIEEGMLSPPEDGNYIFVISTDPQGCFYLSEEPLKGDPDLDIGKMINYQDHTDMSFDNSNKSKTITLSSEKVYYFRHITFSGGKGRSWVGFKKDNDKSFTSIPGSWLRYKNVNNEEIWNSQFKPNFERIYLMDLWNGQDFKKNNDQSKWNFYKVPAGSVIVNSNDFQGTDSTNETVKDVLTDNDGTTEYRVKWWPPNVALPFPHIFDIDMGSKESFQAVKIGRAGNTQLFGSQAVVQIFAAPYNYTIPVPKDENDTDTKPIPYDPKNYSIDHIESLIWEGQVNHTNSEVIELDKIYEGRYLRLKFVSNNISWKDGHPGRTCISGVEVGTALHNKKIYPITNTRYITKTGKWDERRGGCYYNGKGYTGYANSKMEIRIPKFKPEIGIIGDFYPDMGKAVVKIDGKEEGIIGDINLDPKGNARKLTKASRAYKSLLFYKTGLDTSKQHTMTIEVTSGSVTLAGILAHQMVVKWNTDDDRYPTILKTEFDDKPIEITDWDTPSIVEDEFVPPTSASSGKKKGGGLGTGAIIAIVIVVIVVVAAAAVGVFIMYKKQIACFNRNGGDSQNEATTAGDNNDQGTI